MNENLTKAINSYSLHTHSKYAELMYSFSKDTIISIFTDLLTRYINDKNSSTVREFLTVSIAGYQHSPSKIGANGYKHTTAGDSIACEAKPKNIYSSNLEYQNNKQKKLNGGGNFTDFNWKRFEKYRCSKLNMLVSGFVDGKLIYILEFPFLERAFVQKLHQQLKKRLPDGDKPNEYVRSANFNYSDFIDSPNLKIVFCDKDTLNDHKQYLVGRFYGKLLVLVEGKK